MEWAGLLSLVGQMINATFLSEIIDEMIILKWFI
jgi:hypothetical protein